MSITANAALATAVKAVLLPYLGRYSNGATAWVATKSSGALIAEGLAPGMEVTGGLEAIFSVWPSPDYDGRYEFAEAGIKGVVHYELVLKAWENATFPAYQALVEAYPLMTSSAARRTRTTPGSDEIVETMTTFIPILI